jgi:hypothetical protein
MPIMGGSFVSLQEMSGNSGGNQHGQNVEAKSFKLDMIIMPRLESPV